MESFISSRVPLKRVREENKSFKKYTKNTKQDYNMDPNCVREFLKLVKHYSQSNISNESIEGNLSCEM
ncbi:hypothetical protein CR513_27379, partial [Mucuna pruriens]